MDPSTVLLPPDACPYASGPCEREFPSHGPGTIFFVYPSSPSQIAATIDAAIQALKSNTRSLPPLSWKQLPIHGQVIFCEICDAIRHASAVVADVTTLNFNLMFEIGFALGLGIPLIPVRDPTYIRDKREFEELGVLDTLGYVDFANSTELASRLDARLPGRPIAASPPKMFRDQPLYVLKGRIETEGAIRLMSILKKSGLRFRAYDPIETPRLSMMEARRQVLGSFGVVAHLLSPHRQGAVSHNALCALVCGMAMAQQKTVLMIHEEQVVQPIDYRDIIQPYTHPDQLTGLLEPTIRAVVASLQAQDGLARPATENLLEKLDLGDTAAENEIFGLESYFVRTGQFTQAKQGHARIVIGRKGTGKTAIFYGLRSSVPRGYSHLMLDLKPEGHQFTRLRENVLAHVSLGLQEHTMTAIWNYLLLTEIARKIIYSESKHAYGTDSRLERYNRVRKAYEAHDPGRDEDFSQRLLQHVDRMILLLQGVSEKDLPGQITEKLYSTDIRELSDALGEYLEEKEAVWLLIDNIDKGWPTRGTTSSDIVIVRALLEATRKIQRQLQGRDVDFKCLVFLRTDIFEHLLSETPDKGKDTAIRLDWEDIEVFKEIVRRRIEQSTGLNTEFSRLWPQVFESHISTEDSFSYIVQRTLMRPRDLLMFLHRAVEVALNRNHGLVTADDIRQAEKSYSEDLLLATAFEIGDIARELRDVLYAFDRSRPILSPDNLNAVLERAGLGNVAAEKTIDVLLWFGFLGVIAPQGEERYSYNVIHNINRLKATIQQGGGQYVIHPGFRAALNIAT